MRISDWSSDVCSSDLFVGTMHFGLDDVDGARARVALFFQIVDGDQRCEDGIEDAFGYFIARFVEDGRIGHQVADVADEQDRKSAVSGKSESVRVDRGGRRIFKKKKKPNINRRS